VHGELKSAPTFSRCPSCGKPMQILRKTPRFGELPDLFSFYCVTCDAWRVKEGSPVVRQPDRPTGRAA
jgi:hypothetical protein